jgi:hypothetical protein
MMESLYFGELLIEETEVGLQFRTRWDRAPLAELDSKDVQIVLEFLKRHLAETANRRSSFRLDLGLMNQDEANRLSVTITHQGQQTRVRPLDISLTGLFLETDANLGELGAPVQAEICYGKHTVCLKATVVRHNESRRQFALHFPVCLSDDGELTPPAEYRLMLQELERVWLDASLGLEWSAA